MQKLTKAQLQQIKTLTSDATERKLSKQAVVYGSKIIQELPSGIECVCFFTIDRKVDYFAEILSSGLDHYVCNEDEFKKISGQQSPEGIGAIITLPELSDLSSCSSLLILDQIQDPGNLGTLIRSAYALGIDGIIFVKGGCDPLSEKALRSSQGAIFHLPYKMMNQEELHAFVQKENFDVLVGEMRGEPVEKYLGDHSKSKIALFLGNEGQGILNANHHWKRVSIPMIGNADSLNVAIAGSIFMYLLNQKQGHLNASI